MAFPLVLLVAVAFMLLAIVLIAMHLFVPVFLDSWWPLILWAIILMLHMFEGTLAYNHSRPPQH